VGAWTHFLAICGCLILVLLPTLFRKQSTRVDNGIELSASNTVIIVVFFGDVVNSLFLEGLPFRPTVQQAA
jgi:glycopeptide antibiotics resistance protein